MDQLSLVKTTNDFEQHTIFLRFLAITIINLAALIKSCSSVSDMANGSSKNTNVRSNLNAPARRKETNEPIPSNSFLPQFALNAHLHDDTKQIDKANPCDENEGQETSRVARQGPPNKDPPDTSKDAEAIIPNRSREGVASKTSPRPHLSTDRCQRIRHMISFTFLQRG